MVEHKCEKEIKEIGKNIKKMLNIARGLCYFSTHKSVLSKKARVENFKWKVSVKTYSFCSSVYYFISYIFLTLIKNTIYKCIISNNVKLSEAYTGKEGIIPMYIDIDSILFFLISNHLPLNHQVQNGDDYTSQISPLSLTLQFLLT